jgi:hypothetical protein
VHEVTRADFEADHRRLPAALRGTSLEANCTSRYKGPDGKVTTNWPLHTYRYRLATWRA